MKDKLGGRITQEFVRLRSKTYCYLIDNDSEDKKAKVTKKCVIKRKLKIEDYKNCLEATQLENKINHLERNEIYINFKRSINNNKLILKHCKDLKVKDIML